jgi:hypothetical protein
MARKDRDMPDGARTPASFSTVDEQTKAQAMRAAAPEAAIDDSYFTKVVSGGKTQAQLDALANARTTAATIRDTSTTMSSRVDPVTGKVITTPKGTIGLGTGGTGGVTGGTGGATTYTASDGTKFTDAQAYSTYQASLNLKATAATTAAQEAARVAEEKRRQGQSAYALLFSEFERYGMGALVEPLKQFIQDGISPSEFTLRLRETDAYKKRFAANAQRIAKGLRALSEAEYITMEDQYQNVMRQYGLPDTYYTRGEMGRQEGFEKFIAGDVSAVELEDRISTAQKRVLNANPEVTQALKQFYPDITNADILAYTLDPKNAIENIKRKVTTAEIGGAALQAGLQTGVNRADVLRAAGVTKESAQQGFGTIAGGLQRGSQLASIYGEDPYTQTTAEQEVFNIAGAQEARKQRQKLTGLEKATFGGQTGLTSGALARDRAGAY